MNAPPWSRHRRTSTRSCSTSWRCSGNTPSWLPSGSSDPARVFPVQDGRAKTMSGLTPLPGGIKLRAGPAVSERNIPMTTWQHCVLEWLPDQVTLTVYGQPAHAFEATEWEAVFARLGTEGWELVSTLASP